MEKSGNHREAILCLWAICTDGRERLLEFTRGNTESGEAWLESLRDLVSRGLSAPVLMTSDGAPGLTSALEEVFPEALRQRCLAHKICNVTAGQRSRSSAGQSRRANGLLGLAPGSRPHGR